MTTQGSATLRKLSDIGKTVDGSANDIRGRKMTDKNGREVGKVEDLIVDDRDRKVRFLLVGHGGFLGIGETKSFVPVDAITEITENEVFINHTLDHVAAAPRYDPDLINDRAYHGGIFKHYGYAPYWTAGYLYPGPGFSL